jgi:DNA-binding MarR family transcriptional regulator
MSSSTPTTEPDYTRLLQFRTNLRQFLRWSEREAAKHGLTAAQHQLLLAIKGHPAPEGPSLVDIAGYLLLRHNSVVGLVDRAQALGLVARHPDPERHGTVRLALTAEGESRLHALSHQHVEELARLAQVVRPLSRGLDRLA